MSGEVKSKVVIKNGKTKTCDVVQIDEKIEYQLGNYNRYQNR